MLYEVITPVHGAGVLANAHLDGVFPAYKGRAVDLFAGFIHQDRHKGRPGADAPGIDN